MPAAERAGQRVWRRPSKRRVRAIRDRLRELYGRKVNHPHCHPIAELVRTILSQNTNDTNRDVAYDRLRERFPTWEEVRDAPLDAVADAIRPGGLAPTKAPRIQEAMDFLTEIPGVGRKTAACVMIFALGRPEIPVDTHVYRVGGRLGLFPPKASFEVAHDEMLRVADPEDSYELHINLIEHGRQVCRPRPRCNECALARMCPYRRQGGGPPRVSIRAPRARSGAMR